MHVRRFCTGLVVFLGALFLAQLSTPPAQAQESTPEGLVFDCLTDAGYDVLDVYGDQDAGMVVMEIASAEWDEALRSQIVWGWYCLYPVYEDSEGLITLLEYEARYLLTFHVDRADFGAWLNGEMSDAEFAAAYTYAVFDMQIGDWISETDFMHVYFPGAEPVIQEEESIPRVGRQPEEAAFSDDFSDDGSGLVPEYADDQQETTYANGEYHVSVLTEQLMAWTYYPDMEFDDFTVQVQARWVDGSREGDYGLLIRVQPDSAEWYLFGINAEGYYHVYRREQGEWTELVGLRRTGVIHGDGEWDLLRIEASGPSLTFLVNGQPLVTVDDEAFTAGAIALYAGTSQDSYIHAAFDNLTVWTEEAPSAGWSLVMEDDFSDDDSGWPSPLRDVWCRRDYDTYMDGEYHVISGDGPCMVTFPEVYRDFAVEVDGREVEESEYGWYGVLFKAQGLEDPASAYSQYYYLGVYSHDGEYELFRWDSEAVGPTDLQLATESASVNLNEDTNRFRVETVGDEISVYLNGDLLTTVSDPDGFREGSIGFFAAAPGQHVAYDNLKMYVPRGPVTGAPSIGPVTWYRYVGEDGEWHDPVTEYPSGTTMLIGVWDHDNMEDGLTWGEVWSYEGDVVIDERDWYEWAGGQAGSKSSSLSYTDGGPLPSGDYELKLYVEDELMQTASTRIR